MSRVLLAGLGGIELPQQGLSNPYSRKPTRPTGGIIQYLTSIHAKLQLECF